MQWDPRRLAVFVAVVEHRSFTRAAAALSMTQPAVSRQMAALEAELGVRLVSRGPHHVAPTAAGVALVAEAAAFLPRAGAIQRRMAGFADPEGGAVRLGAVPSALVARVPLAIQRLRDRRPLATVEIQQGWSAELTARTALGELDISMVSASAAPAGAPRLPPEPMVAVVPAGHRLDSPARLSELAADDWLVATEPGGQQPVLDACAAAGFSPRITGATSWDAAGALIASGLGVALTPHPVAERLARLDAVRIVELADGPAWQLALVRAPHEPPTAIEEDLVEALSTPVRPARA